MYIIIIIIWYILHYIDIAYTTLPTKNLLKRLDRSHKMEKLKVM